MRMLIDCVTVTDIFTHTTQRSSQRASTTTVNTDIFNSSSSFLFVVSFCFIFPPLFIYQKSVFDGHKVWETTRSLQKKLGGRFLFSFFFFFSFSFLFSLFSFLFSLFSFLSFLFLFLSFLSYCEVINLCYQMLGRVLQDFIPKLEIDDATKKFNTKYSWSYQHRMLRKQGRILILRICFQTNPVTYCPIYKLIIGIPNDESIPDIAIDRDSSHAQLIDNLIRLLHGTQVNYPIFLLPIFVVFPSFILFDFFIF